MDHANAQGVDERMINVHLLLSLIFLIFFINIIIKELKQMTTTT